MIYEKLSYDMGTNNDPHKTIDALWCQSANNRSNIGLWYYPNGTQVPLFAGTFFNNSAPSPLFSKRLTGQIALAKKSELSGCEGLYTCIIPDENGVNQTLVVGIFAFLTYIDYGQ